MGPYKPGVSHLLHNKVNTASEFAGIYIQQGKFVVVVRLLDSTYYKLGSFNTSAEAATAYYSARTSIRASYIVNKSLLKYQALTTNYQFPKDMKEGDFHSRIKIGGKMMSLGHEFKSPEDASEVFNIAKNTSAKREKNESKNESKNTNFVQGVGFGKVGSGIGIGSGIGSGSGSGSGSGGGGGGSAFSTPSFSQGVTGYGKKFRARITMSGKVMHLGSFDTEGEASRAYQEAKKQKAIGGEMSIVGFNNRAEIFGVIHENENENTSFQIEETDEEVVKRPVKRPKFTL